MDSRVVTMKDLLMLVRKKFMFAECCNFCIFRHSSLFSGVKEVVQHHFVVLNKCKCPV
jgi:hypothetical protein